MARSSGLGALIRLASGEMARQERNNRNRFAQIAREQKFKVRLAEKQQKELARNLKISERDQKQQYLSERRLETDERNKDIRAFFI
jgi:hypothetical protein